MITVGLNEGGEVGYRHIWRANIEQVLLSLWPDLEEQVLKAKVLMILDADEFKHLINFGVPSDSTLLMQKAEGIWEIAQGRTDLVGSGDEKINFLRLLTKICQYAYAPREYIRALRGEYLLSYSTALCQALNFLVYWLHAEHGVVVGASETMSLKNAVELLHSYRGQYNKLLETWRDLIRIVDELKMKIQDIELVDVLLEMWEKVQEIAELGSGDLYTTFDSWNAYVNYQIKAFGFNVVQES